MATKEEWKDAPGFEGLYKVSNHGRVKSMYRQYYSTLAKRRITVNERVLRAAKNSDGYSIIVFTDKSKTKRWFVHRLIAQLFLPNPLRKTEVNHIDCNPGNNHVSNLEWCTRSENVLHSYKTGRASNAGFNNKNCKITNEILKNIRDDFKNGLSYKLISDKYDFDLSYVYRICKNQVWKTKQTTQEVKP